MTEKTLRFLRGKKIAICEGQPYTGSWEDSLIEFFKAHDIKHKVLTNLYKRKVDLSKFDVLCFATTNTYHEKVKKLLQFDTSNLKMVIVLNEDAFFVCYKRAEELNIPVLNFSWDIWEHPEFFDSNELLSDATKKYTYGESNHSFFGGR